MKALTTKPKSATMNPGFQNMEGKCILGADERIQQNIARKRQCIAALEGEWSGSDPLIMQPPNRDLLFTLEELGIILAELMDTPAPTDENGRILDVRPKGMWFEAEIARLLGYLTGPRSGVFPDLRHQLIEAKHHVGKSITIDFGRHHPASGDPIPESWNQETRFRENEVRYVIALAPPPDYHIVTLIIQTGHDLEKTFGVSLTQTIKYQMGIPKRWREEHWGELVVGDPREEK